MLAAAKSSLATSQLIALTLSASEIGSQVFVFLHGLPYILGQLGTPVPLMPHKLGRQGL
jgi:hypothetical protein